MFCPEKLQRQPKLLLVHGKEKYTEESCRNNYICKLIVYKLILIS